MGTLRLRRTKNSRRQTKQNNGHKITSPNGSGVFQMKIRKAVIEDLKKIIELNRELFHYDLNFDKTLDTKWPDKNKEYFKERITGKNSIALVAEDGKKIIGYLLGAIRKAEGYRSIKKIAELENMFVVEEHRGKGIGKLLINKFMKWAKNKKMKRIRVVASAQNVRAIKLYKNNLFSEYDNVMEADI